MCDHISSIVQHAQISANIALICNAGSHGNARVDITKSRSNGMFPQGGGLEFGRCLNHCFTFRLHLSTPYVFNIIRDIIWSRLIRALQVLVDLKAGTRVSDLKLRGIPSLRGDVAAYVPNPPPSPPPSAKHKNRCLATTSPCRENHPKLPAAGF